MAQPTPPEFKPSSTKLTAPAKKSKTGQPLPPADGKATITYENNPFSVAASGIDDLFKYAKVLAIIMLVLSVLGVLGNAASNLHDYNQPYQTEPVATPTHAQATPNLSMEQVLALIAMVGSIALIVTIILLVIGSIFAGLRDVSAAAVATRTPVSFGEAFNRLFARFGEYLWLQILIIVKVFLWSLLLIIPGIIMAVRYSLAGTAFFARNMKANEALRYSTTITKGGWLTAAASYGLFNIITLGLISALVDTGVRGTLFRQYDAYNTANLRKPSPHWLTICYFILIALVILTTIVAVSFLGLFILNHFSEV